MFFLSLGLLLLNCQLNALCNSESQSELVAVCLRLNFVSIRIYTDLSVAEIRKIVKQFV